MSTTHWPQRPPESVTDLTAWWEGTPGAAADLTRLRRELQAAALCRSRPIADGADDAALDRLLLIFEELASNGLRHGLPPVRVLVATVPTGWLLDVSDAAVDLPPAPASGRDAAAGGMGLPLVARLSAAHGWVVREGRKHVWARIDAATLLGPARGRCPRRGRTPRPRPRRAWTAAPGAPASAGSSTTVPPNGDSDLRCG